VIFDTKLASTRRVRFDENVTVIECLCRPIAETPPAKLPYERSRSARLVIALLHKEAPAMRPGVSLDPSGDGAAP
jgi:hypothetical protein